METMENLLNQLTDNQIEVIYQMVWNQYGQEYDTKNFKIKTIILVYNTKPYNEQLGIMNLVKLYISGNY